MNILVSFIVGILLPIVGFLTFQATDDGPAVGAALRTFISEQLAGSPTNGYVLSTDGTNNVWIANSSAGGGGLFVYEVEGTDIISPKIASTSNTAVLQISSINATSTATSSTFAGGILVTASSTFTGDVSFDGGTGFYWDNTNKRLSIGDTGNTISINGATALGSKVNTHVVGVTDILDITTHSHNDTALFGSAIGQARSRGTEASPTIVQNGDTISRMIAYGYDGTDYAEVARIDAFIDGTPSNGTDMPGKMVLATTPDGAGTAVERITILANGNVGIGDTSPASLLTVGNTDLFQVNSSGDIVTESVIFDSIENSITLAGNPGLAANTSFFGTNGIIFEGATADTLEGLLTTADITSTDKTWTLPNTTGTIALLTSDMTGTYDGNNFAGGAVAQGDLLYGSAAGVISELAKDTNATRYLSNQGTSNNPSWNQINLTNGVTGTLPVANGGTGITSLGTGIATWWGTPSSANFLAALTDILNLGDETSFEIPNSTNPTVSTNGEIAINTSTSSIRFYSGAEYQIKPEFPLFGVTFASSSLEYDGGFGASGTTTETRLGFKYPVTATEIYCKTDTGTTLLRIGDGSNWSETLTCTTSGATQASPSNGAFIAREDIQIQVGTSASSPNKIYLDVTGRWTTD